MTACKIAVFASGEGSNFQAIADAVSTGELEAEIVGLVSDQPSSPVIRRAANLSIPVISVSPTLFSSKAKYESAILRFLEQQRVSWVALAGYMRIIGPTLLDPYAGRILNIHPSLLPNFPGAGALRAAFESGVGGTGVTVHLVDAGVDTGAVVAQRPVWINPHWSFEQLKNEIHKVEHELYPRALQGVISGELVGERIV